MTAPPDTPETQHPPLGAFVRPDGVLFRVWAPSAQRVELVFEEGGRRVPLEPSPGECFERFVPEVEAAALYRFSLDGGDPLPDPASRFQPQGVHGPSQVVDPGRYRWNDAGWRGIERKDLVFYELHVGTFTGAGTYAAVVERLKYLRDLGVTAVELMPVAEFPGRWNWGYDPAALFAPAHQYGTPDELRALVDAAHQTGLAVFLDVIYNHFGPDGCYAPSFGKFFTEKHSSPWGQGINLDDEHSEGVRGFFIQNALHWLTEYHFDGLRLDATHAMQDDSQTHFLAELSAAVESIEGHKRFLIAEDARNLARLVHPRDQGGYGLDGIWADDFHHQIRNITAGDEDGYFEDYADTTASQIAATIRQGWFHTGQRTPRGVPRGSDPSGLSSDHFVFCIQNHDQIGNRPAGERLSHNIPMPLFRAASSLLLFAPQLPLLFMGQEWAATTPFQYFTDHHDELGRMVTEGRRREFEGFAGFAGEVPDPQDPATFERSKLRWRELDQPMHAGMLALYRDLLAARRGTEGEAEIETHGERAMTVVRGRHRLLVSLGDNQPIPLPRGLEILLDTEHPRYAIDGRSPRHEGGRLLFHSPGAVLCLKP